MNNKEVMQQALEALENSSPDQYPEGCGVFYDAIDALKAALEQPEQEAVAQQYAKLAQHCTMLEQKLAQLEQRKPLTDESILHFVNIYVGGPSPSYPLDSSDWINFARAIEAAHGIKEGT
jgi:uncharacterized membrane protein YccC